MVLEDMKFFGRKPVVLEGVKFFGRKRKPLLGTENQGHPCHCLRSTSHLGWYVFVLDFDNFIAVFDRQNTELEWITKKQAKHSDNIRSRA